LLVGLNDYSMFNQFIPSDHPAEIVNVAYNNVTIMKAILENVNEPYSVSILMDVSKKACQRGIAQLSSVCDSNDVTLVYIFGHGASAGTGDYSGAILFPKVDEENDRSDWINYFYLLKDLYDDLNKIPGKKILVLGQCGAGAALDSEPFEGDNSNTGNQNIRSFMKEDFIVICSASSHQNTYNDPGGVLGILGITNNRVSYFEKTLGEAILFNGAMPADNDSDGHVTVKELESYVLSHIEWSLYIIQAGNYLFNDQRPVFWSNDKENDILFSRR